MEWTFCTLAWAALGITVVYGVIIFLIYRSPKKQGKPLDGWKALQGLGVICAVFTAVVAFDYADRQAKTALDELQVQRLIQNEIASQTSIQQEQLERGYGNIGYSATYGEGWTIYLVKTSGNIDFPEILFLVPTFNLSPSGAAIPGRKVPIRRDDYTTTDDKRLEIPESKSLVCEAQNKSKIDCNNDANLVQIQIEISTPKGLIYAPVNIP